MLIVRTAGINCDYETKFAFELAGAKADLLHINFIKDNRKLTDYQIICVPGGFSYGDDLGAGKILSLEFVYWLKESLMRFTDKGGLILGICNGFQVLVKTGILPGMDFKQKVTLTANDSGRFEDRWVYLKTDVRCQMSDTRIPQPENIWLKGLPETIMLPVAHGEGKFYAEAHILDTIEKRGHVALRYIDPQSKETIYPYNPNGSLNNIAGITDITGKILGLMPHPERCIYEHHMPFFKHQQDLPWGRVIFTNIVTYFKA
ncbi:MAG: phosphoribosylformylglycinamidine synthase I [Candidatus Omnitrophota bacterium]